MKLWQKEYNVKKEIEEFTIGKDNLLDLQLAEFDVLGSMAHITMLESIGLLEKEELPLLLKGLKEIYKEIKDGNFTIPPGVEDVHSQVEMLLTQRLGEAGKKIHSGRSRNDQVLLDLKLFTRSKIEETVINVEALFDTLISLSEKYKDHLLPGYTHLQVAMPSSFGLWFGAYAESLKDDLQMMQAAFKIANQNPLGSAAGYGSSFPLNRQMTTDLLGFDNLNYNVVYAQMGRGKTEMNVASALASIAYTLGKISMDICLYIGQDFGFITLPNELTTGSSIMPHKKNPDVFELTRAKCNKLMALPNEILMIISNLPSGYHRDLQIIKESFIPAFEELNKCINMMNYMAGKIIVKEDLLTSDKYKYIFSVERVNQLVLQGVPFREAYKIVGEEINSGNFKFEGKVNHTHEGSLGNLNNQQVNEKMKEVVKGFAFEKVKSAVDKLLS
ncbi:MAG TPA: argininosuccinate lyase [Cytophagales bacterium]|nr:argininosuccinate lyase [Cytophagales bacterium]